MLRAVTDVLKEGSTVEQRPEPLPAQRARRTRAESPAYCDVPHPPPHPARADPHTTTPQRASARRDGAPDATPRRPVACRVTPVGHYVPTPHPSADQRIIYILDPTQQ